MAGRAEASSALELVATTRPLTAIALRPSAHFASSVAPGATAVVVLSLLGNVPSPWTIGLLGSTTTPSVVARLSFGPSARGA